MIPRVKRKQNRLKMTSADTWFTIFMKTITPAQIHSHVGFRHQIRIGSLPDCCDSDFHWNLPFIPHLVAARRGPSRHIR